jgi:hypothetical protein
MPKSPHVNSPLLVSEPTGPIKVNERANTHIPQTAKIAVDGPVRSALLIQIKTA